MPIDPRRTSPPPDPPPRRLRRPLLIGGVIALVLLAGAAAGGYVYYRHRTGNIYHPHARFVTEAPPTLPARPVDRFSWPLYGYTKDHTRYYPAPAQVRPPFTQIWVHPGGALLEFPPVLFENRIFQLGDDGVLTAISKYTGRVFWQRRLGTLSASSPAVSGNSVYVTVLSRGRSGGRIAALDTRSGAILWSRNLPSASESSPLLDRGRLYFGSQNGLVYALEARTGRIVWTYHASGAVKASPTLAYGNLYFGDYSGHVQALNERTGHRVWISGSGGTLFGSGTFYSTAAVIYGRVFLGNTDGRVYAYDAATGALDWAHQTGAYVYASPAVVNAPGLGPTIYLGSYDGDFYALDARSGHVAWQYHAGGRISGSATVIGRIVYFADLAHARTIGLGISTGRPVFSMGTGAFDPVISDGRNLYLTGYSSLSSLAPTAVLARSRAQHALAASPAQPVPGPFGFSSACASSFLVNLTSVATGACQGASGAPPGTG
jgi:outer membrane protein assembly factor BamB